MLISAMINFDDDKEIGEAHKIEGLFKPFDKDNKGFFVSLSASCIKKVLVIGVNLYKLLICKLRRK